MRIIHVYPYPFESYYPKYLDRVLPDDAFDEEIACHTDLEVRYLAGLQALGDRCTLLYPRRFGLPEKSFTHRQGYEIRRFPITWFEQRAGISRGTVMLGMLRYLAQEKPDVVHFQGLYAGGYFPLNMLLLTLWVCRRLGIPCYAWYHIGSFPEKGGRLPPVRSVYRALRAYTLRRLTGITSINQVELERLFDPRSPQYYGVDFSRVPHTQMANTFDPALFHPTDRQEARRNLGLAADKRYLLLAARLFPGKGLHYILEIMPALIARFPDVQLLVIGEFIEEAVDYRERCLRMIAERGLQEQVRFLGRVEHHQGLPLYYSAANVFVLPTVMDTFAAVNIEALACGTPVVSTDVAEIPRYLKPGAGIVIPPHDTQCLLEAVSDVLSGRFYFDPAVVKTVLSEYDYRQAAQRLRNWYIQTMPVPGGEETLNIRISSQGR